MNARLFLIHDDREVPVLRWRIRNPCGGLVMAFPGNKASTEDEARRFAKHQLGIRWRDSLTIEAVR